MSLSVGLWESITFKLPQRVKQMSDNCLGKSEWNSSVGVTYNNVARQTAKQTLLSSDKDSAEELIFMENMGIWKYFFIPLLEFYSDEINDCFQ